LFYTYGKYYSPNTVRNRSTAYIGPSPGAF